MSDPKKQKTNALSPEEAVNLVINNMSAINTTPHVSDRMHIAAQWLENLRPGVGLLGNDEEERDFNLKARRMLKEDDIVKSPTVVTDTEAQVSEQDAIEMTKKMKFGDEYYTFEHAPEDHVHYTELLGPKWTTRIRELYAIEPLACPPHMTITPHYHQLKFAAQALHACKGPQKGILCGDDMGLGKTIQTILAMYEVRDQPGFSMVVCPKSVCQQWITTIKTIWEEGHGLTVFYLENSRMSAHQLFALGIDVVVVSYEQVESCHRAQRAFVEKLEAYTNDTTGLVQRPERPVATLHSSFWKEIEQPIKILALDEAQVINKRYGIKHQAVKNLFYKSVIILSGTLAHNKWSDISGYLAFLKNHPFSTHRLFMKAFARSSYTGKIESRPDIAKLRRLQRFLQAFLIARPPSTIAIKGCTKYMVYFKLPRLQALEVYKLTDKWNTWKGIGSNDGAEPKKGDQIGVFSIAMEAQILSLHPLLHAEFKRSSSNENAFVDEDEENPIQGYLESDQTYKINEPRGVWLEKLKGTEDIFSDSARLRCILRLYKQLRQEHPGKKMIIFSQYLKFLDIIGEGIKRIFGVESLRYDGTVPPKLRTDLQIRFENSHPSIPLLLTVGAGGTGLNLTSASIVIQSEIWWNVNTEWQAIRRVWRQLQENEVLSFQVFSRNGGMDRCILEAQTKKANVSSNLMRPLIRRADQGPHIQDLLCKPQLGIQNFTLDDGGSGSGL